MIEITPEVAHEMQQPLPDVSLETLQKRARRRVKCDCGQPEWRMFAIGLCFTCTTGESDSSEDYELIQT